MATDDFFRARLDQMIDLRHPLAVLASRMPWSDIEAALAPAFAHRVRTGRVVQGADMFGPTMKVAGAGVSNAGRPRLPIRLMVALLYLKHAYNESDESLVERWAQDVYFQFFSGQVYFEPRLPCDPAQISRFRRVLGEAGVEQLLKTTIEAAVDMGAVKKTEFERVIVDTTVQSKAIAHPTDSRLLEVARDKIARLAKRAGIQLKQTHEREGKALRRKAGGYAHAKQFKRLRGVLKRQRTILGRLLREVRRKMGGLADDVNGTELFPISGQRIFPTPVSVGPHPVQEAMGSFLGRPGPRLTGAGPDGSASGCRSRMCSGIRDACSRSRYEFPSMGMTTAWCNSRSSNAVATTASPKMSDHSPKPRLPVMTIAQRS